MSSSHALAMRIGRSILWVARIGGENNLTVFLAYASFFLVTAVILQTQGNVLAAVAVLGVLGITLITVHRLDWGLYLFLGFVLVFDHFGVPGYADSWTFQNGYFWPLNLLFPGLGIGIFNPMELHIMLIFCILVVVITLRKKITEGFSPALPAILFFAWMASSLLRGGTGGGDLQMGFWEIRALGYLGLMIMIIPSIVTSKDHIEKLMWVCIVAISYKALQGLWRFILLGFNFGGFRTLTNHEDPLFCATLIILVIGLMYFRTGRSQLRALRWLLPLLLSGFYVGNRRAAYLALAVSLVAFVMLLSGEDRKKILKVFAVGTVLFVIYLAAFWNTYGRIGMIAQSVRSIVFSDDKEKASTYKDYASGLARKQEDYNTSLTVQKAPIAGIGFGKKFESAIKSWGEYALKGITCHNEIFWILGKGGAIGFMLFFLFLNSVVLKGAQVFHQLKDPYLKAVCAMCTIAVIAQVVVSYADMQLTFYRNMVYLGTLVGLIPAIHRIDQSAQPST